MNICAPSMIYCKLCIEWAVTGLTTRQITFIFCRSTHTQICLLLLPWQLFIAASILSTLLSSLGCSVAHSLSGVSLISSCSNESSLASSRGHVGMMMTETKAWVTVSAIAPFSYSHAIPCVGLAFTEVQFGLCYKVASYCRVPPLQNLLQIQIPVLSYLQ